eukprot:TRINITY_DN29205_c0_g1_i1.p1 TRINITY_DN29205_c0_g1~~TRINITY_DN29205_c0_g1_i1.p1  ORF type:complete len:223 (+),score=-16.31 TRINITY_DN29205_c0_g1_i1:263-931(+)
MQTCECEPTNLELIEIIPQTVVLNTALYNTRVWALIMQLQYSLNNKNVSGQQQERRTRCSKFQAQLYVMKIQGKIAFMILHFYLKYDSCITQIKFKIPGRKKILIYSTIKGHINKAFNLTLFFQFFPQHQSNFSAAPQFRLAFLILNQKDNDQPRFQKTIRIFRDQISNSKILIIQGTLQIKRKWGHFPYYIWANYNLLFKYSIQNQIFHQITQKYSIMLHQ